MPGDDAPSGRSSVPKRTRVLMVEDHPLVRRSAVALINCVPGFECCGEADAIAGTAMLVGQLRPDIVVLDLRLRDGDAFGLIETLKQQFPSIPLLVFSQTGSAASVDRALRAGARGYLLKADAPDTLIEAMRAVLGGRLYVSRSLADYLLEEPLPPENQDSSHPPARNPTPPINPMN